MKQHHAIHCTSLPYMRFESTDSLIGCSIRFDTLIRANPYLYKWTTTVMLNAKVTELRSCLALLSETTMPNNFKLLQIEIIADLSSQY